MMITVVETNEYRAKAKKLMNEREQNNAINFIANNAEKGDLIEGTGGVRKIRIAIGSRGKSGGVRIIYYYHNKQNPVLLFAVFGKNEKANLTKQEKNELYTIIQAIKKEMKK